MGALLQCLLVTEDVTWEELAPTFIPEIFRRHLARQRCRGFEFDTRCLQGKDDLVAAWDEFAPQTGVVVKFTLLFYKLVGRPGVALLEDVAAAYDQRWGLLRDEARKELVENCHKLARASSVAELVPELLPDGMYTDDYMCELILWAERFGRRLGKRVIPAHRWPDRGDCRLLQAWRHPMGRRLQRRRQAKATMVWRAKAVATAEEQQVEEMQESWIHLQWWLWQDQRQWIPVSHGTMFETAGVGPR